MTAARGPKRGYTKTLVPSNRHRDLASLSAAERKKSEEFAASAEA